MIAYWPIVIVLIGLLIYGFAKNPKLAEVGRIIFFCGMLVVALWLAGKGSVKLLR